MEEVLSIPYADIPHFPISTVEGHSGALLLGKMGGRRVAVLSGRFHYYEGYTPGQVVFPIRVLRKLGVGTLLISNAAGGMNAGFRVGDLMLIRDHISFFIVNPLIGPNEPDLGTRFPDMSQPYDKELQQLVHTVAKEKGISLKEGVYCGVTGPTFETRAEYKLLHVLGGDAVGMSTVQEVIAAVHAGIRVMAMSVITDMGIREEENTITHQEVLEAAAQAEPKLTALFVGVLKAL
jgi:purine-nucleoside phosphorylase